MLVIDFGWLSRPQTKVCCIIFNSVSLSKKELTSSKEMLLILTNMTQLNRYTWHVAWQTKYTSVGADGDLANERIYKSNHLRWRIICCRAFMRGMFLFYSQSVLRFSWKEWYVNLHYWTQSKKIFPVPYQFSPIKNRNWVQISADWASFP